ncbi:MAG: DUF4249 domain-containing protein [Bacteroidota bacterium]|nr:DUF4249 domain-containing protein [Bacteroidota bacterium]
MQCRIPYDPSLKSGQSNSLVAEGFIDGASISTIKLSRTRQLTVGDTAVKMNELNAVVSIEDDHQNKYSLTDAAGKGIYSSSNVLNLNPANQYHLHIITSNGKEYLSDFVPFKPSPPIDKVDWELKGDGLHIFLDTHDPNNATRYYRWEYNETWEFHSVYYSTAIYNIGSNSVTPRSEPVFICWQSDNSNNVLLGSSANLTSDVIDKALLTFIPFHDNKLSVLYSIWVKQYALDLKGYNYWQAMKNNSENVGSIFGPQPNQTVGNIHCISDPSETVVGYIGAGNSFATRIFISNVSMPTNWNIYPDCPLITVPNNKDSLLYYFNDGGYDPVAIFHLSSGDINYSASYGQCVDCTTRGSNIKPDFWP